MRYLFLCVNLESFLSKIAKHKLAHGWRPHMAGLRKYLNKISSWPKVKLQGERVRGGKGEREGAPTIQLFCNNAHTCLVHLSDNAHTCSYTAFK